MDSISFNTEGFVELEAQLKALAEGYRSDLVARNTLVKAVKAAMEPVLQTAQVRAPYDEVHNKTGVHLRETLRIDGRIPSDKDKMSEYVKDTDSVIGIVSAKKSAVSLSQEFGNARTAAQPFLRISLETNMQKVLSILKSELAFLIPVYARKLNKRGIK
jgi:hypothetical protein